MRDNRSVGRERKIQQGKTPTTIVAALCNNTQRITWRSSLQRDGVRVFWFDEQDNLEEFLDTTYADLVILSLSEMNRYSDMKFYPCRMVVGISDNPDDIDLMGGYGYTWLPELTTKDVESLLNT